jgi:hypothetical protein
MINTYQAPHQESRRYSNSPYARNYCPDTAINSKEVSRPVIEVNVRRDSGATIIDTPPREDVFSHEYQPAVPQQEAERWSSMALLLDAANPMEKEEIDRIKRKRNTESAQRYL